MIFLLRASSALCSFTVANVTLFGLSKACLHTREVAPWTSLIAGSSRSASGCTVVACVRRTTDPLSPQRSSEMVNH